MTTFEHWTADNWAPSRIISEGMTLGNGDGEGGAYRWEADPDRASSQRPAYPVSGCGPGSAAGGTTRPGPDVAVGSPSHWVAPPAAGHDHDPRRDQPVRRAPAQPSAHAASASR
ncbi:hypothetical protein [Streptomyces brevispora]|uniref:Uncharacterized protein n=1 Tax=Streptomyces brevispora TaxID=887462 RepID=A0ABZ1G1E3_9ACTN|nr:hypothetical protein [Streptomyces brevispora]WSC13705.1 hypothetical protein OIE64_13210 [Streptomyces brevispora]